MDGFWLIAQAGISLIYLLYFLLISRLKELPKQQNRDIEAFVTVLIAAKNEAKQLEKNLLPILQQAYFKNNQPNFEVIVINDHSTDHSANILKEIAVKYSHFRYIDFQENSTSSKKRALTKGIEQAKGKYLVFTDADCKPASKFWLHQMLQSFGSKKIVLGYGGFYQRNSWLNKLQAYETFLTAMQYFSFAQILSPYMGVGRNIGYQKQAFTSNNGFSNHLHIASGDDDLFIQEVATKENTAICLAKNAFTFSEAPSSYSSWIQQKKRHLSTSYSYSLKHQILLGSIGFFRTFYWIITLLSMVITFRTTAILLFLVFWLSLGFLLKTHLQRFDQKRLLFFLPILDAKLMLFYLILLFSKSESKATSWK